MSITSNNLKIYSGLTLAITFALIGILFGGYIFLFLAVASIAFAVLGYNVGFILVFIGFILCSFAPIQGMLIMTFWIGCVLFRRSKLFLLIRD